MNNLTTYITEKLKISRKSKFYTCQPQTKEELREILKERLAKDKNADLNDIDVSSITDFVAQENGYYGLFYGLDPHNIDISEWDVSNVENMSYMFWKCENFTGQGLENWDVSKVENMYGMFSGCKNFNYDLSDWDVSNVENMSYMFRDCSKINCDLSKWDVSNVKDMFGMFDGCKKFTGKGLEKWNVSNVKDIRYMFDDCTSLKNKPSWYDV